MDPLAAKRQRNAPAWVIAMWHLEDLLRAQRFDPQAVEDLLIAPTGADPGAKQALRLWYKGVMDRMRAQGVTERGHLLEVDEVVNELEFLHEALTGALADEAYTALWHQAAPGVRTLQQKAGDDAEGPVRTCLSAVYGVLVLRAQGRGPGQATLEAEGHMRRMLDALGERYRHMHRLPGISLN